MKSNDLNSADMIVNMRRAIGLTPSAHTVTQCANRVKAGGLLAHKYSQVALVRGIGVYEEICIKIILVSGCRVSEALGIEYKDIYEGNQVVIKGIKGSRNRFITLPNDLAILVDSLNGKWRLDDYTNRFRIYRLMKQLGMVNKFENSKKASVTHSVRHLRALDLKRKGFDEEQIKDYLGHKSISSVKFYLKQPKK